MDRDLWELGILERKSLAVNVTFRTALARSLLTAVFCPVRRAESGIFEDQGAAAADRQTVSGKVFTYGSLMQNTTKPAGIAAGRLE